MIASLSPRLRIVLSVLAIAAFVGVVCAKLNTTGNLQVAGATANVVVDDAGPSIVERRAAPDAISSLQKRAELYARLLVSAPVLADVARRANLPPEQLSGVARSPGVPYTFTQP